MSNKNPQGLSAKGSSYRTLGKSTAGERINKVEGFDLGQSRNNNYSRNGGMGGSRVSAKTINRQFN
jgi:hypothetical protein